MTDEKADHCDGGRQRYVASGYKDPTRSAVEEAKSASARHRLTTRTTLKKHKHDHPAL